MRWQKLLIFIYLFILLPKTAFAAAGQATPISTPTIQSIAVSQTVPKVQAVPEQTSEEARFYSTRWSYALEDLQRVFTITAIIVGGVWTYFNFFKGRVYKNRLEPNVSGVIVAQDECDYLLVEISLKNLGESKAGITQKGSALRILSSDATQDLKREIHPVKWKHRSTLAVFEKHAWMEPAETIKEQYLVPLSKDEAFAYRLELRIVSEEIEWNSTNVICHPKSIKNHQLKK